MSRWRTDVPCSTLFGDDFALLDFRGHGAPALQDAARARGVPLRVHALPQERAAARLYERRLVLVRPDGHVAWRADAEPDDPAALIDTIRGAGLRAASCRAGDLPTPPAPT